MAISFYSEEIDLPAINQEAVREWVRAVAKTYGKKAGEISYIFCSDEKILEVNRQYLQHDYYTDIITFDYTSGDKISGDLFISLDTVRTNSEAFHTDYNEELHRTIIRNQPYKTKYQHEHRRNPKWLRPLLRHRRAMLASGPLPACPGRPSE